MTKETVWDTHARLSGMTPTLMNGEFVFCVPVEDVARLADPIRCRGFASTKKSPWKRRPTERLP
ncbi:hypothetical protein J2W42_004758 [Rhizobium tibeticum]|nr:hypothetical protein [Rhizobium tibeticum]